MLDEPACGLSHGEVDELGDLIGALRDEHDLTVLIVEHHMGLVMRVSDQVVVLNFGQVIATGPPASVQTTTPSSRPIWGRGGLRAPPCRPAPSATAGWVGSGL